MLFHFHTTYTTLPEHFYTHLAPTPVRAPRLIIWNHTLADELGLNAGVCADETLADIFSGNALPEGATPLAQAYAGHQFGHFTMLGDGRAHLIGEHIAPSGARFDVQLKGSGPTPYSRRGDGRAALGPMLREYIISEAMHALNIPTTRSLAVVATGEAVLREEPLAGAVLTRIAASHLRVGTFEYAATREDVQAVKALAGYAISRHYPEAARAENPYLALFDAVMDAQAQLVASWLSVGFIHGVMNTDNASIAGETIDYGPCAFMDAYDPATVFSSIDHQGRYAYANQPRMAQWNMARFAETLLPLLDENMPRAISIVEEKIEGFARLFQAHWLAAMRNKLGLIEPSATDADFIGDFLQCLQRHHADYTNSFRLLASDNAAHAPLFQHADGAAWFTRWQARMKPQSYAMMRKHNPAIIPRNHRVEEALSAANQGNFAPLHRLLAALKKPYDDVAEYAEYTAPPAPQSRVYQTFCGT